MAEDRETGQVGWGVYAYYASRYGLPNLAVLFALWGGEQAARVLTNWWLARWTAAEAAAAAGSGSHPRSRYLGVYLGLSLAFVACTCARAATNLTSALRASRAVHAEALHAVVRSPVSFFDATPTGRVLNRFSRDTDEMDYLLPQSANDFGNCMMQARTGFMWRGLDRVGRVGLHAVPAWATVALPLFLCANHPLPTLLPHPCSWPQRSSSFRACSPGSWWARRP